MRMGDSGGNGCSKGGQYPPDARGLDALAHLSVEDNDKDNVSGIGGQGGGKGGGWGVGGGMIIDLQSICAVFEKDG